MKYRMLGALKVSAVGLGCTFFDTADIFGARMRSALNIGQVAFSPLANGLLSKAYDRNSKFDPKLDYRSVISRAKR